MDFKWPFPEKMSPQYRLASNLTMFGVTALSKLWIDCFNYLTVHNKETLLKHVRDTSRPLITVANHHSNMDDPLCWALFDWKFLFSELSELRYTMTAHNICFTNSVYTKFFSLGRCVPVVRGAGVYQKSVDFCIDRLNQNGWVHMFPEGKVNLSKDPMRLKWGVGRMIADCKEPPVVLPFWHLGFDDILPSTKPLYPRVCKKATILFGEPLDFATQLAHLRTTGATARQTRKAITDVIQDKMYRLEEPAKELHLAQRSL
uniref:Tafazzin family protein n=1 Tax=Plectus sambesii TaxID=2011161 RepID=A0A914UPZ4_9BILA